MGSPDDRSRAAPGPAGPTSTGPVSIRAARRADAAAIAAIHNQGIEDRVATLDTALRDPEGVAGWLAGRGERHPVRVCARAGDVVVAWGSLNPFQPRAAYDHVADFSLYVERAQRGRGLGRLLLDDLVERARELAYHKLVLAAFPWNEAGIALYRARGFREVGTYREQGRLDAIGPGRESPAGFRSPTSVVPPGP